MSKLQPSIAHVMGFRAAGVHAGLKKDGALDMALIVADRNCELGAVFTQNRVKAAPVLYNMERLAQNNTKIRAVVINTKSANACTGASGMDDARRMAALAAEQIGCQPEQVLVMSTGVIGAPLPMPTIEHGIHTAAQQLGQHWEAAATAIMTTDTRPKLASVTVQSSNGEYTVAGISKGSGMIAPNMATMLGVLVTDAALTPAQAQTTLAAVADESYNRIVVDGDTSTNDMVTLLANGASGVSLDNPSDVQQFQAALQQVAIYLAKAIVRDGEGVSKFITLDITGAPSNATARMVAQTIATSPLVKTAFYGEDANWGRILAAAGRADVPFEPDIARLWIANDSDDGLLLYENGMKASYDESRADAIMQADTITVTLDLGAGTDNATIWTCDLSHDYVSINADYRT